MFPVPVVPVVGKPKSISRCPSVGALPLITVTTTTTCLTIVSCHTQVFTQSAVGSELTGRKLARQLALAAQRGYQ